MKKSTPLFFAALALAALAKTGSAQTLTITDGSDTFISATSNNFTTTTNGDYTLKGAAPYKYTFPTQFAGHIGDSALTDGPGWAYSNSNGVAWLASTDLTLSDPSLSYSVAFQNTTSTSQTYTFSVSVPFPTVTYNPSKARASFSGSLVSGTDSTVTATPIQTAYLTSPDSTQTPVLFPLTTTFSADAGGNTFNVRTDGQPQGTLPFLYSVGPNGTFDALTDSVSVTLDAGAFISFTGRVEVLPDVVAAPEPSTYALFGASAGLAFLFFRRRFTA